MTRSLALAAALALLALPASAAVSPQVEAAIKSIAKIEADAGKFKSWCNINKELGALGDKDVAKAEALDKQLDDLLRSIGRDVYMAMDIGGDLDPASEDGQAFDAALDALEEKCGD